MADLAPPNTAPRRTVEYRTVEEMALLPDDRLNAEAKRGWELVTVHQAQHGAVLHIFKRERRWVQQAVAPPPPPPGSDMHDPYLCPPDGEEQARG